MAARWEKRIGSRPWVTKPVRSGRRPQWPRRGSRGALSRNDPMPIAEELAKRIVSMKYEDLPPEAVRWAKISFVDTIGCAFAGIEEQAPQIAQKVLTRGTSAG